VAASDAVANPFAAYNLRPFMQDGAATGTIEVQRWSHTFISWDGKPLPPTDGEKETLTTVNPVSRS
jgi:hypothetical protein